VTDTVYISGVSLLIPLALWGVLRLILPSGPREMDQNAHKGSFFALLILYSVFFYAIVAISCVLMLHINGPAAVIMVFAMIYALMFNGWTTWQYEMYLHSRYPRGIVPNQLLQPPLGPSNYTVGRYALTLTLAISAFSLFVVGVARSVMEGK
jgi:hypothetical protein